MLNAGIREPAPVKSLKFVNDLQGIAVPRLGWQFLGEREYNRQLSGLREAGYRVIARDMVPPTISWYISKPTWGGGTIVVNIPIGFPDEPSTIGVVPPNRPFFNVSAIGSDLQHVIQNLDEEITSHGTSQSNRSS
jgi:hypothetical protein